MQVVRRSNYFALRIEGSKWGQSHLFLSSFQTSVAGHWCLWMTPFTHLKYLLRSHGSGLKLFGAEQTSSEIGQVFSCNNKTTATQQAQEITTWETAL